MIVEEKEEVGAQVVTTDASGTVSFFANTGTNVTVVVQIVN